MIRGTVHEIARSAHVVSSFQNEQRAMNINRYTNAKLAGIHFIYGLANRNGHVAIRLCGERCTIRWQPNHQTLARVYQNLAKRGSFRATIDGTPINSEMDLVARISIVAATICETRGIFEHARQSMSRRDEAHFWLNGYVNKQNCRIWSEANPQVYVETPLHPEKLTVWCALWAGGILLQKR
ncbi:hypothetical protein TNCV_2026831 [Trichonephila clavipes]|nr:hypothetical protein TNCV_2026831 [Trichonephila clavipes]